MNIEVDIKDRELFIGCYIVVKSFEKYNKSKGFIEQGVETPLFNKAKGFIEQGVETPLFNKLSHILIYTNTTTEADKCQEFIKQILIKFNKSDIYNKSLHSNNKTDDIQDEIEKFKQSKYGILSAVYLFGEGFNCPRLNGTCVIGTMASTIRIIQYLTRANRLEKGNPDKIAYNIIPFNNKSEDKIKHILNQLGNIDENIENKIIISSLKEYIKKDEEKEDSVVDDNKEDILISEDVERIKLMLRHRKILKLDLSQEQTEYMYMKSLNKGVPLLYSNLPFQGKFK